MGKHYTDPLAFILDIEAESDTDGRCTNLEPSRALQRAWGEWGEAVANELLVWGQYNKQADEIAALIAASDPGGSVDIAYDVYMTLDGAGVGMWDGRWDPYFSDRDDIKGIQKYLGGSRTGSSQGVLGEAFHTIQSAIRDEAYEQCKDMRGTRIEDDDLNGAPVRKKRFTIANSRTGEIYRENRQVRREENAPLPAWIRSRKPPPGAVEVFVEDPFLKNKDGSYVRDKKGLYVRKNGR